VQQNRKKSFIHWHQIVQVEDIDEVFFVENKLLDFARENGGNSPAFFSIFEEDDSRQLPVVKVLLFILSLILQQNKQFASNLSQV